MSEAFVKSPSGVPGVDSILDGGLPATRTTVVMGGPGCGKTMFGMQFLVNGAARHGEPGLFLSFEESPATLAGNFGAMDLPFASVIGSSLHVIDGRPALDVTTAGTFDLHGLLAIIHELKQVHGAKRIVVDGIDALFTTINDAQQLQTEIKRLLGWLADSELTAILTIKAHETTPLADFDFIAFAADCVIQLRTKMHGELQQRLLRVVKYRGSNFSSGDHAYSIVSEGIRALHSPARTSTIKMSGVERCSTGIERLDRMLMGGFLRGSTTLISGLPGSSKTTFAAAFLQAGCASGERCLFVGFDEPADQMVRDMRSVGIDLKPFIDAGLLRLESFSAASAIADVHYLTLEALIDAFAPKRVVIDPISALVKAGGSALADAISERLVILLKSRGITTVLTAVSESVSGDLETTPTRISTVADSWLHLSFSSYKGERNRALTIVKSRGTAHSPQTREVLLSEHGVALADVYAYAGEVLFGSARLAQEEAELARSRDDEQRLVHEIARLDEEAASIALQRERLLAEAAGHTTASDRVVAAMRQNRQADPDAGPS